MTSGPFIRNFETMPKPLFFQKPFPFAFYNATLILVVLNALVFLLRFVTPNLHESYLNLHDSEYNLFALVTNPTAFIERPWTVITYMFLHADAWHIIFNMLALLIFGSVVERKLGSHEFLLYYFFTGILAGWLMVFVYPLFGWNGQTVIGASGAVSGILLAYAAFFPMSKLLIWGIIPVRAYILVLGTMAFSIIAWLFGIMGNVAHLGHLGGYLFGFIYFLVRLRTNPIKEFIHARRYSR